MDIVKLKQNIKKNLNDLQPFIPCMKLFNMKEIINEIPKSSWIDKNVNFFTDLSTQEIINLNINNCLELHTLIKKKIYQSKELTPYAYKLKSFYMKSLSNKLNSEKYPFLLKLSKFIEKETLIYKINVINFHQISRKKTEFELKIGKELIEEILTDILDLSNFVKNLEKDFLGIKKKENLQFILSILSLSNPKIMELPSSFINIKEHFGKTIHPLIQLVLVISVCKSRIFATLPVESDVLRSFLEEYQSSPNILPTDPTDPTDKEDPSRIKRKLKVKCLNFIRLYATHMGIEIIDLYIQCDILEIKISKKTGFSYLKLNKKYFYTFSTNDTPYLATPSNNIAPIIPNESMECNILDYSSWKKTNTTFQLNLPLINELLINFIQILSYKNHQELSDGQLIILGELFDIPLLQLKKHKWFKYILSHILNFNKLKIFKYHIKKKFFLNKTIKEIWNKIHSYKYKIITFLINLNIILPFDHFEFSLKFDSRGRCYPQGFFHYQDSLIREFLIINKPVQDFSKALVYLSNMSKTILEDSLYDQAFLQKINFETTENPITINLLDFCVKAKNKIFTKYSLYYDIVNFKKYYLFMSTYIVDCKNSGIEMINILLNNNKLGQNTGMYDAGKTSSLHYQFASFLQEFGGDEGTINLPQYIKELNKSNLESFLRSNIFTFPKDTISVVYTVSEKKSYCKLLKHLITEFLPDQYFLKYSYLLSRIKTDKKSYPIKTIFHLLEEYGLLSKESNIITILDIARDSNKNTFSKTNIRLFYKLLTAIKYYQFDIINMSFYRSLTKNITKMGTMLLPYNSSTRTRINNYINAYISQNLSHGIITSNSERFNLYQKFVSVDRKLNTWFSEHCPELLQFLDELKKVCKNHLFKPVMISSNHCDWYYTPLLMKKYEKSLYKKRSILIKFTNEIDYKKLGTALPSNYIQFLDSTYCSLIVKHMESHSLPMYSIHDCFRCSHEDADVLLSGISTSFIYMIDQNYIKLHFETSNPELYEAWRNLSSPFPLDKNIFKNPFTIVSY